MVITQLAKKRGEATIDFKIIIVNKKLKIIT